MRVLHAGIHKILVKIANREELICVFAVCLALFGRQLVLKILGHLPYIWEKKTNIAILREKSVAIYFGDSQFRRNGIFNFIISKIYVGKRLLVR